MRIQFQQGHSYDFCRVPANVHAAFMRAYSKGIYYNEHIKDRYQC
nr:KTSC domain-containing protein [Janthinobacterium lividum]